MSTHSQHERRRSPTGFLGAWEDVVGPRGVPCLAPRRGRKLRVPSFAILKHVALDADIRQLFVSPLVIPIVVTVRDNLDYHPALILVRLERPLAA